MDLYVIQLILLIQLLQWSLCIFLWLDLNYFTVLNVVSTPGKRHLDY